MFKLKKIFLIFIVFVQILSLGSFCYAEDDVESTAGQFANFEDEIKITTSDLDGYICDMFEYMPELEFYYAGYTTSYIGYFHTVSFEYRNQDINAEDIHIAKNEEEFIDIIARGILYCEDNIYIIANDDYDLKSEIDKLIAENQIVVMGYKGFTSSTFNSNLTQNICYKISINYNIDTTALLSYKAAAENKAIDILTQITSRSMPDYLKEKNIHDYIIEYTDYSNEDGELSYMPYNALINGRGVCSAYAGSAKIMFDLLGIENYYVSGTADNGKNSENHAWNIIRLDDGYYQLDLTWDDPVTVFGFNSTEYTYFNVTDDEISKNHTWERADFPQCNATRYSYDNIRSMSNDANYDDKYQREDFKSVFDEYKPLNEIKSKSRIEYATETTTSRYSSSNGYSIYNTFKNLPSKHKILTIVIILILLLLLFKVF